MSNSRSKLNHFGRSLVQCIRLSEDESSKEEGEGIYAYAGKPRIDPGEVAALIKAVTSCEPTTIGSCSSGHNFC